MINQITGKIPRSCYVAFSGGRDSVAALGFLLDGHRDITLLYFNHGTEHGAEAETLARATAREHGLNICCGSVANKKHKRESQEEFWRNERYAFFAKFLDKPIVMAHHLDDCVETYLFSVLKHPIPRTIPYSRGNIIRPFIRFEQRHLHTFIRTDFIDDPSNEETKYLRNHIRKIVCPIAFGVNPGFKKIVEQQIRVEHQDLNEEVNN